MSTEDFKDADIFMENLYWWGIPTFYRCDHNPDPAACDIGLVGVPHSAGNGTTERDQHLGPRALRHMSALAKRIHEPFRLDPWNELKIYDLGDVPFPEAMDNEASIQRITDYFKRLDNAGTRPVSMGGDHSITGGIVQAMGGKGTNIAGGEPVALLHFDAHVDTSEMPHWLGAVKSAAHWGNYLVQQGNVDATKSVQIGIRGDIRSFDWLEPSHRMGYDVITMDDYHDMGIQQTVDRIRKKLGDTPVYITFDLDCLDPSVAPAVSNLECGYTGFYMTEVRKILRGMRGLNIVGADIVCMMPTKDNPNNMTAMAAMGIMFEQICLIGDYVRSQR